MMARKTILVAAVGLLSLAGTFGIALFQKGGARKIASRKDQVVEDVGRLTEPMTSSIRNFNPVQAIEPKPQPTAGSIRPVAINRTLSSAEPVQRVAVQSNSLSIAPAEPQVEKISSTEPKGNYAPAFRMVKCQLVNTVDSSNITTPIIGLVTDDLLWNGKMIIPANSELHGIASVDRARERIASEGEFTFILNEADRRGRELVVRGMVLDMERDPEYDTYGITDGSAGLRGDVIRTANADVVKLYAASLISGLAGAFSNGVSGVFGNRVFTNSNAVGLSVLQGAVVNPAASGLQNVLNRYADQISQSIERDGFFVRVPAGKQFYLYCTEGIDLSKAKVGADDERASRLAVDLDRKSRDVRRALPVDGSLLNNSLLPSLDQLINNKK